MKSNLTVSKGGPNFITGACLVLLAILLFSFKISKKERIKNSILTGVWVTGNPTQPSTSSGMKVFDENGSYYNIGFENNGTVITLKGMYKVLDNEKYQENVTKARFNGTWDLQGEILLMDTN